MATYQITIKGKLRPSWADHLGNMALSYDAQGNTLLTGPLVDQVALRGLLGQIWDLNLEVIAVVQVQDKPA
jgi:hypothetical protein